jgi:ABC-type Zn uptake system ZnuABC Zn-binding protein ZnuA
MKRSWLVFYLLGVGLLVGLSACGLNPLRQESAADDKLKVVATTTFIGDVLGEIAGNEVSLTVLLEPGQNPHAYQPTPRDMVNISEADLIFVNGLGLEEFLDDLLEGAGPEAEVIVVSEGVRALRLEENDHEGDGKDHDHTGSDPHVWFDPTNVMIWVDNISEALVAKDLARAVLYQTNAKAYREELCVLDSWIRDQVYQIPLEKRYLVTDHDSLGYFLNRYDFDKIGAVLPALTTEAESSGQELADLIDIIREYDVKAIFVGVDIDPTLSQQVAGETGVDLVPLYIGSLSDGSPAGTYLMFMRYNVETIVKGLD